MSQYRFIASDNTLPEIDLGGFIRMKVTDIKKIIVVPKGPTPWDELDDEAEVLYAASESDTYGLQISICKSSIQIVPQDTTVEESPTGCVFKY